MAEAEFDFPREFQRDILRLLLTERTALATFRPLVSPSHFTDETYKWIAEAAFTVFDAAGAHPGQPSVLDAALDGCPGSLDPEEVESEIRALYEDGAPEDAEYVRGRVQDFVKYRRLRAAAAESEEMLEAGQANEWVAKVNAASVVAEAEQGDDMDLADGAREVLLTMDEMYAGAIATNLKQIDEKLDGGGLCPGEQGLLIGLPGYHKTNCLVNFGIGALAQGKRVAHFVFEGGRKKVATRYYCAITARTKSEVLLNQDKTLAEFHGWMKKHGGSLKLSYYPKETCTLAMLEAKLKRWEAFAGWRPDLLIVDYAAIMLPAHDFDNTLRLQVSSLYRGLGRIAGVWKCPVWTAQQSGREADPIMKAGGVITMRNAAESFEPCRDADIILTTNQTDEEKRDCILRVHGAKMREAESGWTISMRVDPQRALIKPLVEDLNYSPNTSPIKARAKEMERIRDEGLAKIAAAEAAKKARKTKPVKPPEPD